MFIVLLFHFIRILVHSTLGENTLSFITDGLYNTSLATVWEATGRREVSGKTIMLGTVMWAAVVEVGRRDRLK